MSKPNAVAFDADCVCTLIQSEMCHDQSSLQINMNHFAGSPIPVCEFEDGNDSKTNEKSFVLVESPAPVLNTPNFTSVFSPNPHRLRHLRDECYHMRELEYVALPGSVYEVADTIFQNGRTVYRLRNGFYINGEFVRYAAAEDLACHSKELPSREEIINNMIKMEGSKYLWGGNYHQGLSLESALYFSASIANGYPKIVDRLLLKGVDCSGLLYEATNGFTPRNTGSLVQFGRPVQVEGLTVDQIIRKLEPLDIIVWKGHLIVVLNQKYVIDSRHEKRGGSCRGYVGLHPLRSTLKEILETRKPVNDYYSKKAPSKRFVIRRWYPSA